MCSCPSCGEAAALAERAAAELQRVRGEAAALAERAAEEVQRAREEAQQALEERRIMLERLRVERRARRELRGQCRDLERELEFAQLDGTRVPASPDGRPAAPAGAATRPPGLPCHTPPRSPLGVVSPVHPSPPSPPPAPRDTAAPPPAPGGRAGPRRARFADAAIVHRIPPSPPPECSPPASPPPPRQRVPTPPPSPATTAECHRAAPQPPPCSCLWADPGWQRPPGQPPSASGRGVSPPRRQPPPPAVPQPPPVILIGSSCSRSGTPGSAAADHWGPGGDPAAAADEPCRLVAFDVRPLVSPPRRRRQGPCAAGHWAAAAEAVQLAPPWPLPLQGAPPCVSDTVDSDTADCRAPYEPAAGLRSLWA
eukprot:TRINITY_DN23708_c0_g1_i2.p1 TRINITY_DN23708_c0_g1~~TRINITY_DN23708_c0_g1_i2.p1  ORF type:complete len:368 (+),score=73.38 TRINITY_DN23708_c0_g1_i2:84-1187(+)